MHFIIFPVYCPVSKPPVGLTGLFIGLSKHQFLITPLKVHCRFLIFTQMHCHEKTNWLKGRFERVSKNFCVRNLCVKLTGYCPFQICCGALSDACAVVGLRVQHSLPPGGQQALHTEILHSGVWQGSSSKHLLKYFYWHLVVASGVKLAA